MKQKASKPCKCGGKHERIPFRLLNTSGYMNRFLELSTETQTYREAYQKTEKEYRTAFGTNRYSSYSSFRVIKTRYFKTH